VAQEYRHGVELGVGLDSIECQRCRQIAVRLNLSPQIGDPLLSGANGIGAGNKAARRLLLVNTRRFIDWTDLYKCI
jgi:hypothetical protein